MNVPCPASAFMTCLASDRGPGIFEALIQTNYQGYVDLEYEVHEVDPMRGLIASFGYMRCVLAETRHVASASPLARSVTSVRALP